MSNKDQAHDDLVAGAQPQPERQQQSHQDVPIPSAEELTQQAEQQGREHAARYANIRPDDMFELGWMTASDDVKLEAAGIPASDSTRQWYDTSAADPRTRRSDPALESARGAIVANLREREKDKAKQGKQADSPAPPSCDLDFVPGGLRYRGGKIIDLSGLPLAVLQQIAGSRSHRKTAADLLEACWPSDKMATDKNVKDAILQARKALRKAIESELDPLPCVNRSAGQLAWELRLPANR